MLRRSRFELIGFRQRKAVATTTTVAATAEKDCTFPHTILFPFATIITIIVDCLVGPLLRVAISFESTRFDVLALFVCCWFFRVNFVVVICGVVYLWFIYSGQKEREKDREKDREKERKRKREKGNGIRGIFLIGLVVDCLTTRNS